MKLIVRQTKNGKEWKRSFSNRSYLEDDMMYAGSFSVNGIPEFVKMHYRLFRKKPCDMFEAKKPD